MPDQAGNTSGGRIVIAGGAGFLGRSLAESLARDGFDVLVLTRRESRELGAARAARWDGRTLGPWASELEGAVAIVNLAGRSVDCVKTPDHRDEILRSRVESTRALGLALNACDDPPPAWVQMSTAHIYGDPPRARCTEQSALGTGLAPEVGRAWEAAFDAGRPQKVRGVALRTSFVVGRNGGALARLRTLVRLGLGGTVGHGRQGMSWIHQLDFNRIVRRAIDDESMRGIYNVSSPNPVSNREFMRTLRRVARAPIGLPAPAPLVRVGAPLVMRTDPELALYGRYVLPARLLEEGFEFEHPELAGALRDLARD